MVIRNELGQIAEVDDSTILKRDHAGPALLTERFALGRSSGSSTVNWPLIARGTTNALPLIKGWCRNGHNSPSLHR